MDARGREGGRGTGVKSMQYVWPRSSDVREEEGEGEGEGGGREGGAGGCRAACVLDVRLCGHSITAKGGIVVTFAVSFFRLFLFLFFSRLSWI